MVLVEGNHYWASMHSGDAGACTCKTLPVERRQVKYESLAERSPGDAPWDLHRAAADGVAGLYGQAEEFERLAARMGECSGWLKFGMQADADGVIGLRLRKANFCRVRNCPVCQWRRSLMWKARFYQAMPTLTAQAKARWVFLTLTVRNCEVKDLRETLRAMSNAWRRLTLRKEFGQVLGWVRTTEVTRGADGSAHPHYHVLAMVSPSYFGKHYLTRDDWAKAWQGAMRLDYLPVVDVKAVRDKRTGKTATNVDPETLKGAVSETLKYAIKPSDMQSDVTWFFELTRQIHRMRFIASGGLLKDLFKEEESGEDLLLADDPNAEPDDLGQLTFSWAPNVKQYRRRV